MISRGKRGTSQSWKILLRMGWDNMGKVEKVKISVYVTREVFHRLCAESEASGLSRSDIIERSLARGPLLEAIRQIVREETDSKRT
jgi:hypothetical protein